MVSFSLKVRFYETDLMGVVHHANYLRWFEMGRVEYLRQAGIDLNEMMGEGFMVPIVDVNCRYRQSARFDDEVIIETVLEKLSKVKLSFSYRACVPRMACSLPKERPQTASRRPKERLRG